MSPASASHSAAASDPLDVPFDQYQRYRITADVARVLGRTPSIAPAPAAAAAPRSVAGSAARSAAGPAVLDVGGHHTDAWGRPRRPVQEFLPDLTTVTLDVTDNPLAGFVRGRGDNLPFASNAFDLVCSVDVLEHVPPAARPQVLHELTRVASRAIVLAAPFRHPHVERAEALVADFVLRTCGYVQGQLREHKEFGLPDLAETARTMAADGWSVRVFPFGNLFRWALMMLDKHAAVAMPGGREVQSRLDRAYNESSFATDDAPPCYRHFIVATATSDDPLLAWAEQTYAAVRDTSPLVAAASEIASEAESRSRVDPGSIGAAGADRLFDLLALHGRNQTLQAAAEPLRRDAHLAELEHQRAEQQRHYDAVTRENTRLVQLLRDVERSATYRVGALLRRFGRPAR